MYYMILSLILTLISIALFFWYLYRKYRYIRLRERLRNQPLPESFRQVLEKVPHYRALPQDLKELIRPKLLYFVRTKEFKGIGLKVTDEMRAVISFYACLMVVNMPDECYEELVTILIYPYDVVAEKMEAEGGIYREGAFVLEGESAGDTVVITWNEAKRQAYHLRHHNVVIHELAHVLDFEDGIPDGVPPLERSKLHRWTRVFYRHYEALRKCAEKNRDWGDYRLIGEYAATNEAEFFAVVTEIFFIRPLTLKKHFPDLYEEFRDFYGLDTAELFKNLDEFG